jgi:hypothetical protein
MTKGTNIKHNKRDKQKVRVIKPSKAFFCCGVVRFEEVQCFLILGSNNYLHSRVFGGYRFSDWNDFYVEFQHICVWTKYVCFVPSTGIWYIQECYTGTTFMSHWNGRPVSWEFSFRTYIIVFCWNFFCL